MRPGDGHGERPLIVAGNVDQDLVGGVMTRGFLQMLGEELRIGDGDGEFFGPRLIVAQPARDRVVIVEIDNMHAGAGLGVGASERHQAVDLPTPPLEDAKVMINEAPHFAQKYKCANAYLSDTDGCPV